MPSTKNSKPPKTNPQDELFALFYVENLYYLPHLLSTYKQLRSQGLVAKMYFKKPLLDIFVSVIEKICQEEGLETTTNPNEKCYYLICANNLPSLQNYQKSVLIFHGIGTKSAYISKELNAYDIRFTEGQYRTDILLGLYPQLAGKLFTVGFSKFDTLAFYDKQALSAKYNLDPNKKTILYAPTFYPSSIEKMSQTFAQDFSDYNLLIKPHFFTYAYKKYAHQVRKLEHWASQENVYLADLDDYNLMPFLLLSDIMLSDESSAIFEAAAMDIPIVFNRFIHLRLSYRLFPWRFKKRMDTSMDRFRDIGQNAHSYDEVREKVQSELREPNTFKSKREEYSKELVGSFGVGVGEEIVRVLLAQTPPTNKE